MREPVINRNLGKNLLLRKTDNIIIQFFRYGFAGAVAFAVDFSLLFILTDIFHIYYLLSAAISFIPGIAVNYILSVVWVFNNRLIKNRSMEFIFFTVIGLGGLALNEFFMWSFTDLVGFHYLISKIISTALGYFWNFFAKRYFLFRKPLAPPAGAVSEGLSAEAGGGSGLKRMGKSSSDR